MCVCMWGVGGVRCESWMRPDHAGACRSCQAVGFYSLRNEEPGINMIKNSVLKKNFWEIGMEGVMLELWFSTLGAPGEL